MSHLMIVAAEKHFGTDELKPKVVLDPSNEIPIVKFLKTRVLSTDPSDITVWVGTDNDHLVVQFTEQRGDAIQNNWIHIGGDELNLSMEVRDSSKGIVKEESVTIYSWNSPASARALGRKKESRSTK